MTVKSTISKTFEFSASHQLVGLEDTHPCSRLHGHNYVIRLELTGFTDSVGFVLDYRELAWFKTYVDEQLDHQHLNNMLPFNPTAENMANHFLTFALEYLAEHYAEEFVRILAAQVAVSETPKTWATATSARPWDSPALDEHARIEARRWPDGPNGHDTALLDALAPEVDPHEADGERYRWNFDSDGSARP